MKHESFDSLHSLCSSLAIYEPICSSSVSNICQAIGIVPVLHNYQNNENMEFTIFVMFMDFASMSYGATPFICPDTEHIKKRKKNLRMFLLKIII